MNMLVNFSNQILAIVQTVLILAGIVGGVFVFKNSQKAGIVKIQSDTIEAMQRQIDALKEQNKEQQKKLDHQEFELQAMREALKDEGILITIDGERVTIKNVREPNTTRHIVRKSPKTVKKPDPQERKDL